MMKHPTLGFCLAVFLGSLVGVWSIVGQAQERQLCTMPGKVTYSPGALVTQDGEIYRCLYVWDQDLAPSGVAWVKMVAQGIKLRA